MLAKQSWLELVRGDVCLPESLPRGTFTHVLHAAADSTLGPRLTPLQRYDQIVTGTRNMLDLAVQCGIKNFLLVSSGAVYGDSRHHAEGISENCHVMPDPLLPANAYGVAKRGAEHLCSLYQLAHGIHIVVARCFAFVGPDLPLDVHFAIGNFIRDALWNDEIVVRGDGSPIRSYMYQDDLARWLSVLLTSGRPGEAYNVGSDHAISVRDLAYCVRDVLSPQKTVRILGTCDARTDRNAYLPNISKARVDLGLALTFDLGSAIRTTGNELLQSTRAHHAP